MRNRAPVLVPSSLRLNGALGAMPQKPTWVEALARVPPHSAVSPQTIAKLEIRLCGFLPLVLLVSRFVLNSWPKLSSVEPR